MNGLQGSYGSITWRIIASILSGAGVWIAGNLPGTGFLACIAFVPLILAIQGACSDRVLLLYGAAFSLCWSMLKLEWIAGMGFRHGHINAHLIGWLLLVLLFLFAHLGWVVSFYYLWIFRSWPCCLASATTWSASELLIDGCMQRGLGLSLDSLRLATSQLDGGAFTQCADLGGGLLVGWLVTLTNGVIVDLAQRTRFPTRASEYCLRGTCMVIALSLTYNVVRPYGYEKLKGPNVLLVPNHWIESDLDLAARKGHVDLCVWPEGAHNDTLNTDLRIERSLSHCSRAMNASVIVGCKRLGDGQTGLLNTACHYSPESTKCDVSDKRFLAPISEFIPPVGQWLQIPPPPNPYVSGEPDSWEIQGGYRVGLGICNDATFAAWGRSIMAKLPDFLIVITSESFSPSPQMRKQLLATSQLRAIETRRSILRCAMKGVTCLIDGNGSLVVQNHDWNLPTALFIPEMPFTRSWSLYQTCGDCCSLSIVCVGGLVGEYVGFKSRKK